MAVLSFEFVVADIALVRPVFDRIKVYRSTTGAAGAFTEVSTPASRPALLEGVTTYPFVDFEGDDLYYYRIAYFNAATGAESSPSEPQQGARDPALDVLSVEELKQNFLFGVDLTDDNGTPFPDSLYQFYIKSAVSWVEKRLDVPLRPLVITDERHDFVWQDYKRWIRLQLLNFPVISVEALRMVLPRDQTVVTYDLADVYPDKDSGQLRVVPTNAQPFLATASLLPFTSSSTDEIPDVFRVDYTAGFARGRVPDDLRELVGKMAALGPLNIAGDLVFGAGLAAQSVSLDGLTTSIQTTQSPTNAGYGARIVEYWREVKNVVPELRRYYKGIRMVAG